MAEKPVGVNAFRDAWRVAESSMPQPTRVRNLVIRFADAMAKQIQSGTEQAARECVESLYAGDLWLIRGMFSADFMRDLKRRTVEFMGSEPSSFHKMLEGSPNFHRRIDLEAGKNYSFECCKHAAYFYRWNDDPLNVWPTVTPQWRLIKRLMGLAEDEYEGNTPKAGVVDRVQVVRYPPAIGFLEPHCDPYLHQRLFFSGYMSRRGDDFQGGGFYAVGPDNQVVDIESHIRVGDACVGYATVYHGVAPCDRDKVPDWDASDGRWFLSMYSNASDEVPNRHTGRPVKLDLPGVLPCL